MAKAQAEGKKVIIRRLPPGMTADELWNILGDEWKPGKGKVDWSRYDDGEISHDPSDPSRPARCYLHVLNLADITILSETVQQLKWEDAKHTSNDPALVGPPYVEIAPLQKIPAGKKRTDPRQGTIDSEPEFMKFLESLTAPTQTKEADPEQVVDDANKADVKVTTTPLVEYLKEKKANKAKEAAIAKSAKHGRQESQNKGKEDTKKKGKESKSEKAEKSTEKEKHKDKTKEPVKLLTKKVAAQEVAEAAKTGASQSTSGKASDEAAPKSRRANIAAAAKILQRDLGLSPGSAHRRARQDAAKADVAVKADTIKDIKENENKDITRPAPSGPSQSTSTVPPSTPTAPKSQISESSRRRGGGKSAKQNSAGESGKGKGSETNTAAKAPPMATPVILKRKDESASTEPGHSTSTTTPASAPAPPTGPKAAVGKATSAGKTASAAQKKGSTTSTVTPGATRGFVKHANPSQGVTEPLLKQAMEAFGPVTFVEIDKRKGFAYVDFGDHDGLVKAVAASPVPVSQGTVQVLERKETKKTSSATTTPAQPSGEKKAEPQTERSKRGGRGRGRRGGANADTTGGVADSTGSSTSQPEASAGTAAPPG
ncbi:Smg-4/UPF3 family-domain-containing protein [Xylariaceae sp. FL1651]|nr:Smg-4/UPF3 family-domain-containing protein [Xylariaceae sp. FL1651]